MSVSRHTRRTSSVNATEQLQALRNELQRGHFNMRAKRTLVAAAGQLKSSYQLQCSRLYMESVWAVWIHASIHWLNTHAGRAHIVIAMGHL
eukprot:4736448-Karenia_brevis.AAC.1